MLYFSINHVQLNLGDVPLIIVQKCMIKIFLESDKFSHEAGVTKHATNTLARKSHQFN